MTGTGLLVVDKQQAYFNPARYAAGAGTSACVPTLARIDARISAVRAAGAPIVFTRMIEHRHFSPRSVAAAVAPDWQFHAGSRAYRFVGTRPHRTDRVIGKAFADAFNGTGLAGILRALHVRDLTIVGALAGRCVLVTAFAAIAHGFTVTVPPDLVLAHPENPGEHAVTMRIIDALIAATSGSPGAPVSLGLSDPAATIRA